MLYVSRRGTVVAEDFISGPYFGSNDKDSGSSNYNGIQGRNIGRAPNENLYWFKKIDNPSDQPNLGLRSFTRVGACWQEFRGPVFVMRAVEDDQRNLTHADMDMRDVRNAADFLSQTYRDGYDQDHLRELHVLGSTIACDGAVQQGKPKWAQCVLNVCDGVWNAEGSIIANLLGLPLLIRGSHNPYNVDPRPGFENDNAALLGLDVNSKCTLAPLGPPARGPQVIHVGGPITDLLAQSSRKVAGVTGFGSSLQKFSIGSTGTVHIVRADGKPLPKEHAEALCSYIKDKVEPQLIAAIEGLPTNAVVPQRDEVLNSITKGSFLEYYEALKETKIAQGQLSWSDLPSPYDIKQSDMQARAEATLQAQQREGFEQQSEKLARQERAVRGRGEFTLADLQEALGENVPF